VSIDRYQVSDIVRQASSVLFFLAVPVVIVFAWRGWHKLVRGGLAPWRHIIGAISLAAISTSWLYVILFLVFAQTNQAWAKFFLNDSVWLSIFWANFIATVLVNTLKGRPRLLGILAGLLMVGFWLSSIVE
jgi:hypothetical protein